MRFKKNYDLKIQNKICELINYEIVETDKTD